MAPPDPGADLLLFLLRTLGKAGKLFVRFAFGAPIIGQQRTDATFFRAGREPNLSAARPIWTPGLPTRWSYLAGWQRALLRWLIIVLLWAVAVRPWPTFLLLVLAGAVAVWLISRRRRKDAHHALAEVLNAEIGPFLGIPEPEPGALRIPRDYASNKDAVVRLTLPEDFPGHLEPTVSGRRTLDNLVSERLGDQWRSRWGWERGRRHIEWCRISPVLQSYESQVPIRLDQPRTRFEKGTSDLEG